MFKGLEKDSNWYLIAILLLALVLRLILINQSLWLDEAIQILAVKNNSYSQLITQYSLDDFHPPLYHLVLKFWTTIFGITEFAARSFSVLTGIATVYIVYLIGKEIKHEKLGLITAAFLATAPLHIYYSQEARMYSLAAFFVATLVYFFLKVLKTGKQILWFLFTLTLVLTLYTDYLPYLILIPLNLYVFWQIKSLYKNFLVNWLASQLISFLFLLPWLPFFFKQIQIGTQAAGNPIWRQVVGNFQWKAIPVTFAKFIAGRISSFNKIFYAASLFFPAVHYGFLAFKALFEKEKERVLIFSWLIVPVFIGWIISIFIPVFSFFRFLFVLPAMYLILGLGILSFKNLKTQVVFLALVLAVNFVSQIIFWSNPRFWREDWRSAVFYIEANSDKGSAAVFVTPFQTAAYDYYLEKTNSAYSKRIPSLGPKNWQDKNLTTIWLSRYVQPIFDTEDNLRSEIESAGYTKIEERDFNGVTFWRYDKLLAISDQQ